MSIDESREFYADFFSGERNLTYDNKQRYEIIEELIRTLPISSSAKVLDVGSGSGAISEFLNTQFSNITAVDIDYFEMMEKTLDSNEISFAIAGLPYLPFDTEFDLVVCSEVLEHLPVQEEQEMAVQNLASVLKPNGFIVISTPNPRSIHYRVRRAVLDFTEQIGVSQGFDGQEIENWIQPNQLNSLLSKHFDIIEHRGSYYSIPDFGLDFESHLRPVSDFITKNNILPNYGLYQYYVGKNQSNSN